MTPSDRVLASWREHAREDFLKSSGYPSMGYYTGVRVYERNFRAVLLSATEAAELPERYWRCV